MNKVELGQVFTDNTIADYMVSLFDIDKSLPILDPCFGGCAFINALQHSGFSNITGCELDEELFFKAQSKLNNVTLFNEDFLCFQPTMLYKGIIMNPPYIRHEKIDELSRFGISKDKLVQNPIFKILPRTANLYMYFVLKAISLLELGGQLIVIFPSSWLDARVGIDFKEYLFFNYNVAKQIHIHGKIFEEDAIVDVVILKVINEKRKREPEVITLSVSNGIINNDTSLKTNLDTGFNISFSHYAQIRRGLTTGFNEAFINPVSGTDLSKYLYPILSSPKDFTGYSTLNAKFDSLLLLDSNAVLSSELKHYLECVAAKIKQTQKPKTLYEKINSSKDWYALKSFNCKGIIFSYFVRNEMKFVLHNESALIRDNFYIITPRIDLLLMFALLNNHYTYYQLEKIGKKYGAGLLKLQRYDIENVLFPDISKISKNDIFKLKNYSSELIKTGNETFIIEIDKIISKTSNVNYKNIVSAYETEKEKRLGSR